MSGIKTLAGHTLWYGVPQIFRRVLSYALTLLGFRLFDPATTGNLTQIYAVIPLAGVFFSFGLETAIFRFAPSTDTRRLYDTLGSFLLVSTALLTGLLFLCRQPITRFLKLGDHPEYVGWMFGIIACDTLAGLFLSKLRQEERPGRYALVSLGWVLTNALIALFFLFYARPAFEKDPHGFPGICYNPRIGVGYFLLANLLASVLTLGFLCREWLSMRPRFDRRLWRAVIIYTYPLVIAGFAGMVNEMLSRVIFKRVFPGDMREAETQLGIFGANYKLAVLITIFIQVFRLAADPFFFNQADRHDARKLYARIMKFFVIACCFVFLFIALFLDTWKLLIASRFREYGEGVHIVPVLAMAFIFLGVYQNLAIWYKLTNRNLAGARIAVGGSLITVLLNLWWIPLFGYTGAAWATFVCYAAMMVAAYRQGQRHYPIPYATKKLLAYLGVTALAYGLHEAIARAVNPGWAGYHAVYYASAALLMILFGVLVLKAEAREFRKLSFLSTYYQTRQKQ